MDDDENFTLRDKLAVEILNGLIVAGKEVETGEIVRKYIHFRDSKLYGSQAPHITVDMENLIRSAYAIADLMRKVRLSTFE